ncbi:hypothetical protein KKE19_04085 [Patescibacteria group bacterium]|nr:hypothetical protein [Patescibacteria group bacterium]MBU4578671.1 hypothetical protein [Patescibacteria group bacterium]
MDKSKYLDYLQITEFFLNNFEKIKSVEEIKRNFDSKIVDITEETENLSPEILVENHQFIGQKHYDFKFFENNNYWGELSVDFIDGVLRNVRCQLFALGFIQNSWGIGKKIQYISKLFSDNFGKANELDYSIVGVAMPPGVKNIGWIDKKENIFITLRSSINQPNIRNYISIAVEYLIENHKLLIKK